tara:strand:- start:2885 stop:3115 length:231 start_codon:yes stop_codon:yes gene_type:complete
LARTLARGLVVPLSATRISVVGDRFMALRIMVYAGLLHQNLARRGKLGVNLRLLSVLPITRYNGERSLRRRPPQAL